MKHLLTLAVASSFFLSLNATQAITFNLAGDWLADTDGVRGIPNGSLIMLIASTKDKAFDAPSGDSLIPAGSDDVVLGYFTATDANGVLNRGSFFYSLRTRLKDSSQGLEDFDGGDPLLIRWFPTLTEEDVNALPNGAIPYGEFRSESQLPGSSIPWVTPGSNSATVSLSVMADATGNAYNPNGSVPISALRAIQSVGDHIASAASAQLQLSAMANGMISITWPLLEGLDPVGQLQKSTNLTDWENVGMDDVQVSGSHANLVAPGGEKRLFYRVSGSAE